MIEILQKQITELKHQLDKSNDKNFKYQLYELKNKEYHAKITLQIVKICNKYVRAHDIEYIYIEPMNNVDDYNCMIFQDLHKYFKTSHCLIVQADSFVVNSHLWKNEFLEYDYIGGPWPNKIEVNPNLVLHLEKNPVGNGGFSLRSRKLVEVTSKINFKSLNFPMKAEDVIIC